MRGVIFSLFGLFFVKKNVSLRPVLREGGRTILTTMDGPATRTEKKGRDKAKSHGTPYSAKHARLAAAATAAAAAKKEPTKKGKEKK